MRQAPIHNFRYARNEIRAVIHTTPIASHRRMDVINREAARLQLCLDCVKGCTKVRQLSRRKISILCISCALCTIAVQISSVFADSCLPPINEFHNG